MNPRTNITLDELRLYYNNKLVLVTGFTPSDDIYSWCDDHSIVAHYVGRYTSDDIWYVVNDEDRIMFSLRWS